MSLDPATLAVVAFILCAVVGALLMFSWIHDRRSAALGWWSVCALTAALASLLYMLDSEIVWRPGREVANCLFALAYSLSYGAARRFNGKPMPWAAVAVPPAIWALTSLTLDLEFFGRLVLMSLLVGGFGLATARELWSGSTRDMPSQRAGAVVTAVNAIYFLGRPLGGPGLHTASGVDLVPTHDWMSVVGIVIILYAMIFGFLIMAMAKEKADSEHRQAALIDPLTGIANRRSFMDEAGRLLANAARARRPVAAIMFDLDHFKAINDSHGHLVGDQTLIEFCVLARTRLPPRAVFGRLGGEEFAVLLDSCDGDRAAELAEAIRTDLATMAAEVMGRPVAATVSAGIAASDAGDVSLAELTGAADAALYRAKALGRNRVVGQSRQGDDRPRRAAGLLAALT